MRFPRISWDFQAKKAIIKYFLADILNDKVPGKKEIEKTV